MDDDDAAAAELERLGGVTIALAVDAVVSTGEGERRVRIEAGHRFDERFALRDPRSPVDTPLGAHVMAEVLPSLAGSWADGAHAGVGWETVFQYAPAGCPQTVARE